MGHSFNSTEETRLSALRIAYDIAQTRTASHQGVSVVAETTADQLVADAKTIETYINSESE